MQIVGVIDFSQLRNVGVSGKHIAKSWGDRLSSTLQIDGVTDKIVRKVGVTGDNVVSIRRGYREQQKYRVTKSSQTSRVRKQGWSVDNGRIS